MKTIKIAFALILATGTLFTSCKKEEITEAKAEATTVKKENIKATAATSFTIEGMTCAMGCAKVIEGKLAGLEGVQKATVDFDKKTAAVEYDATLQTPEELTKTVEAVADGKTYTVSNVKTASL
jgi:mercuric ion binding protein